MKEIEAIETADSPLAEQTSTALDILAARILDEMDSIVIPDDSADTYPELWGRLDLCRGGADAIDGLAAWNQGEMLNRIKPLPELEAKGWKKIASHGEFEAFLAESKIAKSTAYLLRRMRAGFTREQAKSLGARGMRERIIGKSALQLEEPDITLAAKANLDEVDWTSPHQELVDKHTGKGGGNPHQKRFDIFRIPQTLARMNEDLTNLYEELLGYAVGSSTEERAAERLAVRKIRSALSGAKGMTTKIKTIKTALTKLCDTLRTDSPAAGTEE